MIGAVQHGRRLGVEILDTWAFDADRLRINHIKTPDEPWLHNHPWEWCWALILHGGYVHEFAYLQPDGSLSEKQLREFKPGDINFMPHSLFHRIVSVEPDTYSQIMWGPDIGGGCNHVTYWTPEGLKGQRQMQDFLSK